MTDTAIMQENEQDNDASIDVSETAAQRIAQVKAAHAALDEAMTQARKLVNSLAAMKQMLPQPDTQGEVDTSFIRFAHVTKDVRNRMLDDLMNCLDPVDDAVKAAHRSMKQVKRARLSDEQIDALILNAYYMPK